MMIMINDKRNYIIENNLSYAWGKAVSLLLEPGITEIHPLIVTVRDIIDDKIGEDKTILKALDNLLVNHKKYTCHTVANTIFPISLWNPQKPRRVLFDRYLRIIEKVRQYDFVSKRYGLYFDRLINYGHSKQKVNQLEYIIKTRTEHNNKRRSALQASVINPHLDHDNRPVRGFPCLQQVSFSPLKGGGLSITGYYPQQYIIDRAYGNYLGLCRLGHFMANELGLKFVEMNCIAGIARLGKINKTDDELKDLNDLIKMRIKQYEKE